MKPLNSWSSITAAGYASALSIEIILIKGALNCILMRNFLSDDAIRMFLTVGLEPQPFKAVVLKHGCSWVYVRTFRKSHITDQFMPALKEPMFLTGIQSSAPFRIGLIDWIIYDSDNWIN